MAHMGMSMHSLIESLNQIKSNRMYIGVLTLPGALDTEGFLEMKKLTLQQDRLQLQKAN
jgi:hypothetical protein